MLADDLEWRQVSGCGPIYKFTIARKPTAPAWRDAPQLMAVVEQDGGVRLHTELVNIAAEDIRIGLGFRPVFQDFPGIEGTLLWFEPA